MRSMYNMFIQRLFVTLLVHFEFTIRVLLFVSSFLYVDMVPNELLRALFWILLSAGLVASTLWRNTFVAVQFMYIVCFTLYLFAAYYNVLFIPFVLICAVAYLQYSISSAQSLQMVHLKMQEQLLQTYITGLTIVRSESFLTQTTDTHAVIMQTPTTQASTTQLSTAQTPSTSSTKTDV